MVLQSTLFILYNLRGPPFDYPISQNNEGFTLDFDFDRV